MAQPDATRRNDPATFRIDPATPADVPLILALIRELAEYEALLDDVVATDQMIHDALFGDSPHAEAVVARVGDEPVGFALYFHTFSTFLARPGLYLEDLYVRPAHRGNGYGRRLLVHLARIAVERGCGRFEWSVLDWNELAQGTYRRAGAVPMDEWTVWRLTGEALRRLADEGD